MLPDLGLHPRHLLHELLVLLLQFLPLAPVLLDLTLYSLLRLGQSLQVNEHTLIVGPQLLHLLVLNVHCVLQCRDLFILGGDHHGHLLCLGLKVYEGLFCFIEFPAQGIGYIVIAFDELGKFQFRAGLFLLELGRQCLLSALGLLE